MKRIFILGVLAATALTIGCEKKASEPAKQPEAKAVEAPKTPLETAREHASLFKPIREDFATDGQTKDLEDLGRMLYFEKKLSKSGTISCNSCHQLDKYGVDGLPTSPGHEGQLGSRNSPTVYNAAGHIAQFWDGRAKDVEEQAKGPILNPVEMAMPDEPAVVKVLEATPEYPEMFQKAFPGAEQPISYDNMAKAIGAFERRLVTPSKFDAFLKGDDKALNDKQIAGLNLFVSTGCAGCHNGELLGGTSYQKVGAVKPWPSTKDGGRFEVTKKETDKMIFKTPSLRNIAKTGPYFHDGSVKDLKKAVLTMGTHQLGRDLKAEEADQLVAFLETLTGELPPSDYIQDPHLVN